jgi:hypothetical protein
MIEEVSRFDKIIDYYWASPIVGLASDIVFLPVEAKG